MYIGEPHSVAAITPSWRNLAKPKSAENKTPDFVTSKYKVIHLLYFWIWNAIQITITSYRFSVVSRAVADKIFHRCDSAKCFAALNPGGRYPSHTTPSLHRLHRKIKIISHARLHVDRICLWVIACQVNQIFSIQIPEWNFPCVRPR
jgi:hypothetical protein